ncbi:MAG: AraC family transcriptional regulator [Lapillicoccus sp.]
MQQHVTLPVAPLLAPYVSSLQGYHLLGFLAGAYVGMPSRDLTLVISLGEPMAISVPGRGQICLATVVGGLHDRPVLIHHQGRQHGIQVALTPAGARALLGTPAGALAGLVVGFDDLVGSQSRVLQEQVAETETWAGRLSLVEAALLARLARGHSPSAWAVAPELSEAWRVLGSCDGDVSVGAVARHVGWSPRHLTEQFGSEFGLRPKTAARVMRFERSTRLVHPGARLADVAATCGYADQAHLTREWRTLAGVTPGRWPESDVLANVQDRPGWSAARWRHDHTDD